MRISTCKNKKGTKMKHSKIAIIGAGNVGTATLYALMWKRIAAEIMLIDINEQRCKGEIFDLSDAQAFCCTSVLRQASFKEAGTADIIIIAAGARQKPGQTRMELLGTNWQVISSIMKEIQPINESAIIIMVSNPVDLMAYCAQQKSKLPKNQVFGTGTYLDTQRLSGIIAHKIGIAPQSVHAYMLGEHGETQFAAWSTARIDSIPLAQFLSHQEMETIGEETKKRVYEIIQCKESTFFGIAACVADICECIIFNEKRVLPLSSYQEAFGVSLSLPTILGERGIEKVLNIPLSEQEQELFDRSVKALQDIVKKCKS
jgi:L-lactate dehydrogenase